MDTDGCPRNISPKRNMSTSSITFKYNVNNEAVDSDIIKSTSSDPIVSLDDVGKIKKTERSSSIINKYLKSLKSEKGIEDEFKNDDYLIKEHTGKKSLSGSPIKECTNKSINNEIDLTKDGTASNDTWKTIGEYFMHKFQAVEDKIKSSKSSEAGDIKNKQESIDNNSVTDSEDNSLQLEFDPNSFASTENQVPSLSSSVQNLSELSPPIISHSSTMTDMDIETTSSLETNKDLTESGETYNNEKIKSIKYKESINDDNNSPEIESGIDALEDAELVLPGSKERLNIEKNEMQVNITDKRFNDPNINESKRLTIFNYTFYIFTSILFLVLNMLPFPIIFNGFLIGIWFSYIIYKIYSKIIDIFRLDNLYEHKKSIDFSSCKFSLSRIPQIVEYEPLKKYEGWINVYMLPTYDPLTYNISFTQTAFVKLEGINLRISFTHSRISKRAQWNEQSHKVPFYQHRIYNLEGANIVLLPSGIVKKRHWSKKYPISIILKDKSKVTVYNARSNSCDGNSLQQEELKLKNDISEKENIQFTQTSDLKQSDDVSKIKSSPKKKIDSEKKSNDPVTSNKIGKLSDDLSFQSEEINSTKEFYFEMENNQDDIFKSSEWSKDDLSENEQNQTVLYLFGRTGREKDEWFRRLKMAINDNKNLQSCDNSSISAKSEEKLLDNNKNLENLDDFIKDTESKVQVGNIKTEKKELSSVLWTPKGSIKQSPLSGSFYPKQDVDYWRYMNDIIETKNKTGSNDCKNNDNILWFNCLVSRIIYDTFRNPLWITIIQERIQKKLSTLKLPNFMGPLMVTALEIGPEAPQFCDVSQPSMDPQGLWIDLHVTYTGRVTMTLTTQLNLMSLKEKRDSSEQSTDNKTVGKSNSESMHAVYHSDLDDTAESSSEDEAALIQPITQKIIHDVDICPTPPSSNSGGTSAKRILRMVDKIAASKYFQQVTEYKVVKRAMEGVSNTDLKLSVELCGLNGCLTVNIPPPPSDRIWFGFRGKPELCLKAKPVVGSRVINFAHVTSWIEKKLCLEFEKLLVLPNMEDILIDCMIAPNID